LYKGHVHRDTKKGSRDLGKTTANRGMHLVNEPGGGLGIRGEEGNKNAINWGRCMRERRVKERAESPAWQRRKTRGRRETGEGGRRVWLRTGNQYVVCAGLYSWPPCYKKTKRKNNRRAGGARSYFVLAWSYTNWLTLRTSNRGGIGKKGNKKELTSPCNSPVEGKAIIGGQ